MGRIGVSYGNIAVVKKVHTQIHITKIKRRFTNTLRPCFLLLSELGHSVISKLGMNQISDHATDWKHHL